MISYFGPLVFVISLTMLKEAVDDFKRYKTDKLANSTKYKVLSNDDGKIEIKESSQIKVGDIIIIEKDQRVPADLLLLYADDDEGSVFIRTDQLDGETDWKLRKAVKFT